MSPTISAIIVNYNAGPLLRGCVDSLLACPRAIEIIVVDNASHDGSLDGLPESPQIRIIRNPANRLLKYCFLAFESLIGSIATAFRGTRNSLRRREK